MFSTKAYLVVKLMRPAQWTKNGLLFVALVFSGSLTNTELLAKACFAFIVFSLISGAVYIINDILDADSDKLHPVKCKRPIASGQLAPSLAWSYVTILTVAALIGAFFVDFYFGLITVAYFVLFVMYSYSLKHVAIIDILTIAVGFVMRAAAGAFAINVEISSWLLLCTMLLALFIILGKRRHEILLLDKDATSHRAVLNEYNCNFLDQMISVVTTATLITYSLYTIAPDTIAKFNTTALKYTVIFVLYGIFRYLYIIYKKEAGGRPEKDILTDLPTIINLLLWAMSVVWIIY
jgi:4-hydroxybenzoate polyprenyltransferase